MDTDTPQHNDRHETEGSWNGWYVAVIGGLVLCIVLFNLFSRAFA